MIIVGNFRLRRTLLRFDVFDHVLYSKFGRVIAFEELKELRSFLLLKFTCFTKIVGSRFGGQLSNFVLLRFYVRVWVETGRN